MNKTGFQLVWQILLNICSGMVAIGAIGVLLTMVFVFVDVVGRNFFNHPITGAAEIVKVGVVFFTFMGVPWALWTGRHIRSNLIPGRLGATGNKVLDVVRHIAFLAACVLIFWANWEPMLNAWEILEYEGEGAVHVPVYPVFTIIQVSVTLAGIISIQLAVKSVQNLFHKD